MRLFDRKFGARFLDDVPAAPGVYRFHDAAGLLIYVGMAGSLRRRLGQYRLTGRRKNERKRRALVTATARITWEVCESPLAAALAEIRLIQTLRPPQNVASAYPFLYPYVGTAAEGGETYFCLTTRPEAFPVFAFHGAFRSRDVTGEAFFSLMRLLRYLGHPVPRHRCRRLGAAPHSHVRGFRRLPADSVEAWSALLRGASREPLEALAVRLLEHADARARREETHQALRAVGRFFRREARPLARVRAATGYELYPVPQQERDLLFARYRVLALTDVARQGGARVS
ncbi:MAG TPA: GIY-YIG nuclease family protein [Methylomirabilota bacterium]|nr:GIY-YIG nuclease family protein [Methylomirabilota bacterium]